MNAQIKLNRYIISILVMCGLCCCLSGQLFAGELVTGRYLTKTASRLVLEIRVGSPAPASLIVVQRIPQGTVVSHAEPAFSKYNRKNGEIRWLLRNVGQGSHRITLELQKPGVRADSSSAQVNRAMQKSLSAKPRAVRAEIRCKHPVSRQLMTITVD